MLTTLKNLELVSQPEFEQLGNGKCCLNMGLLDWDLQVSYLKQILSDNPLETLVPKKFLAFQNIWPVMINFFCTCMIDDFIVLAGN